MLWEDRNPQLAAVSHQTAVSIPIRGQSALTVPLVLPPQSN